jgi:hypothetical protein
LSPQCESFFGYSDTFESVWIPLIIGMVAGGLLNAFAMAIFGRSIWGKKEES